MFPGQLQGIEISELVPQVGLCSWLCHLTLLQPHWQCFRPKWAHSEWPLCRKGTVLTGNAIMPPSQMRKLSSARHEPAGVHTGSKRLGHHAHLAHGHLSSTWVLYGASARTSRPPPPGSLPWPLRACALWPCSAPPTPPHPINLPLPSSELI